jgi:hypothetical protein
MVSAPIEWGTRGADPNDAQAARQTINIVASHSWAHASPTDDRTLASGRQTVGSDFLLSDFLFGRVFLFIVGQGRRILQRTDSRRFGQAQGAAA